MQGTNIRKFRQGLGLNQANFWQRVGYSQSAGSRIETGDRGLHPSLQMLIGAVYLNKPVKPYKRAATKGM